MKLDRLVYAAGAVAAGALLVFPPWRVVDGPTYHYAGHAGREELRVVRLARESVTQDGSAEIDVSLLAVELLGTAFITGALARALR